MTYNDDYSTTQFDHYRKPDVYIRIIPEETKKRSRFMEALEAATIIASSLCIYIMICAGLALADDADTYIIKHFMIGEGR